MGPVVSCSCGQSFRASDALAGKRVNCPVVGCDQFAVKTPPSSATFTASAGTPGITRMNTDQIL